MKVNKKIKKIFNIYNLAVIACIIIIAVSLWIIFRPDNLEKTPSGIPVVETNVNEGEQISEEQARKVAVQQFKKLKENVKEENLNVTKIKRDKEEYYYITSANNSVEIKIDGGKITRINTALVKE